MTDPTPEPWADPEDVIDSWIGPNRPDDEDLVALWIAKAEREVRRQVPDIVTRLEADPVDEPDLRENLRDVLVSMVQRVFRNPEMIRQVNETTGPFSESRTYGGDLPGGLGLTADELDKLRLESIAGRAFEVDPLAGYAGPPWKRGALWL